jgi:hypothetical protein
MDLFDQINTHQYLFLDRLSIENDRELILRISEAGNEVGNQENDKQYEIIFDNYIAFSLINESYSLEDETEQSTGRLFRIYSKSKFLNFVESSTIDIEFVIEKNYQHFEFACLNNIVDVT